MALGQPVLVDGPEHVIDVYMGGDTLLVVNNMCGFKGRVGIRVCSSQLCMTSTMFLTLLTDTNIAHLQAAPEEFLDHIRVLNFPDDDGDAMLILMNLLHLEHDKVPPRLPTELLYGVASLAAKYFCQVAIARTTWLWFDAFAGQVRRGENDPSEIFIVVQAAFLLDEPTIFRRMSDLWVVAYPVNGGFHIVSDRHIMTRLAYELKKRQSQVVHQLRQDFDRVVDPCMLAFSAENRHYVDHEPGAVPEEKLKGTDFDETCDVDIRAASLFLGSLRDESIFPTIMWKQKITDTLRAFQVYRVPEFDDNDKCGYCKDVKDKFTQAVGALQNTHLNERCWGLCLDCFKKGHDMVGPGEETCRVKHYGPAWNVGFT